MIRNTLFINGTVTVNDVPLPFANPNTGIPLGDFQPNDAAIINFQVVIIGGQVNNLVTNTATANGLATVNPNEPPVVVEGDREYSCYPVYSSKCLTTVVNGRFTGSNNWRCHYVYDSHHKYG